REHLERALLHPRVEAPTLPLRLREREPRGRSILGIVQRVAPRRDDLGRHLGRGVPRRERVTQLVAEVPGQVAVEDSMAPGAHPPGWWLSPLGLSRCGPGVGPTMALPVNDRRAYRS